MKQMKKREILMIVCRINFEGTVIHESHIMNYMNYMSTCMSLINELCYYKLIML